MSKLVKIEKEIDGMTPGIVWLQSEQTGRLYIFKPDTDKEEHIRELRATRICDILGIEHVRPVKYVLDCEFSFYLY